MSKFWFGFIYNIDLFLKKIASGRLWYEDSSGHFTFARKQLVALARCMGVAVAVSIFLLF